MLCKIRCIFLHVGTLIKPPDLINNLLIQDKIPINQTDSFENGPRICFLEWTLNFSHCSDKIPALSLRANFFFFFPNLNFGQISNGNML